MNFSKKNHSRDFGTKQKMLTISKNVILKTKYVLLVLSMVFVFSCSPEDGEIGPEGPAGQDGNANVTSVVMENQSFSPNSIKTINISQLTQDIFDKGLVYVYINDAPSTESWRTLPILSSDGEKLVSVQEILVGQIKIVNHTNIPLGVHLKFVLIEGN